VLTIDAEDWFHVCGDGYYSDPRRWDRSRRGSRRPRPPVRRAGGGQHRATVFFLGWIARRYPGLVREARRRGHEIGVHGDLHGRVDEMTAAEFREDLLRARQSIEEAAQLPTSAYRAAEWSIRDAASPALAELAAAGFRCDASMMPVPPLGSADNPGDHTASSARLVDHGAAAVDGSHVRASASFRGRVAVSHARRRRSPRRRHFETRAHRPFSRCIRGSWIPTTRRWTACRPPRGPSTSADSSAFPNA
jgi:hypothetical protein